LTNRLSNQQIYWENWQDLNQVGPSDLSSNSIKPIKLIIQTNQVNQSIRSLNQTHQPLS